MGTTAVEEVSKPAASLSILGNPSFAGSQLNLSLDVLRAGNFNFTLYDATGRACQSLSAQNLSAGVHPFSLPTSGLAPGIYTLRLNTEGAALSKIIVLQ